MNVPLAKSKHTASISPGPEVMIPADIARMAEAIRSLYELPVFALVQHGEDGNPLSTFDPALLRKFHREISKYPRNEPIAVLLHSPGGDAHTAYRMAKMLRAYFGAYIAIIPDRAKSAATLFALGASRIVLGPVAELGPLDAQIEHADRETFGSALEVLQTVERLNSEALQSVDAQMWHLLPRCRKRINDLLPITTGFVASMMRPLWEKIDTVQFTQVSRILKVGQDYAARLLSWEYGEEKANEIAAILTKKYPDHGFVIDAEEAMRIGLEVEMVPDEHFNLFSSLSINSKVGTILGLINEVQIHAAPNNQETTIPGRPGESAQRNKRRKSNRTLKARSEESVDNPSTNGQKVKGAK